MWRDGPVNQELLFVFVKILLLFQTLIPIYWLVFFCWWTNHYGKHVICRVQKIFTECQISGTRQRTALPSAALRQNMALGKDLHSAKVVFAECLALNKGRHSAKIGRGLTASSGVLFAECPPFGTRQNIFFSFLPPIFFEALVHYHKQRV